MSCALCLFAAPSIAAAEWHFTPLIGLTFAGRTTFLDPQFAAGKKHLNFGGAVSRFGAGALGAEGLVMYTPGFFQTDESSGFDVPPPELTGSHTLAIMGNLILTTPRRWTEYTLRPFVSGGFGLLRASQTPAVEALPVHASMAGFNLGGGAVGFLSQRTGLRFDLRYYHSVHGTDQELESVGPGKLGYWTASVGVVIRR